jgi:hypothetical protein
VESRRHFYILFSVLLAVLQNMIGRCMLHAILGFRKQRIAAISVKILKILAMQENLSLTYL